MINCLMDNNNNNTNYENSINNDQVLQYNFGKQHFFIGGSIGTGKTTLVNLILEYMDFYSHTVVIKEFINYDKGGEIKLHHLHNRLISNYEFQQYVLDCYEKQLNSELYEEADFVLWVRHPIESLEIFCKNNDSLSVKERSQLDLRMKQMCRRYSIPNIRDKSVAVLNVDTSRLSIEIIQEAIINTYIHPAMLGIMERDLYVFLFCGDTDTQFKRIKKRGRTVELEQYKKKEDLFSLNDVYYMFYSNIIEEKLKQSN
ncbi:hypothetical protein ENU1_193710 [Entamoeba nuttalli P19]|uniref:Deoxynucleoside kinase domain-containing protein n=2 Tax=Entamoeba nuttalli TaxID=412467 RepID=K2GRE4_ENTNP|nr:hypothetical protein ENU1_193710 [Entamoeba nuttalli P19]EKE37533.1 hypothetical protein ENU1_193710 [Entamoeba nuttalli P19]|eukprot:XP_008860128.1 hypothetical protein ENU1_193710 [Entamoeba nuttalli P19]